MYTWSCKEEHKVKEFCHNISHTSFLFPSLLSVQVVGNYHLVYYYNIITTKQSSGLCIPNSVSVLLKGFAICSYQRGITVITGHIYFVCFVTCFIPANTLDSLKTWESMHFISIILLGTALGIQNLNDWLNSKQKICCVFKVSQESILPQT